jgi:hypothetical protein
VSLELAFESSVSFEYPFVSFASSVLKESLRYLMGQSAPILNANIILIRPVSD